MVKTRNKPKRWQTALYAVTIALILLFLAGYRPGIPLNNLTKKYWTDHSQWVNIGPDSLHVRKVGSGPAIFLIHGSFSSLQTWSGWEKILKPHFTVISMDLPGFGLTGPIQSGDYSYQNMSHILWALVDHFGIDSLAIAGNSLGGAIALQMALDHPERTTHLILLDAAGSQIYKPAPNEFSVLDLLDKPLLSKIFLKETPRFLFRWGINQVYADDSKITDSLLNRYYLLMLREGNRKATLQRIKGERKEYTAEELHGLTMPVLIQWGRQDQWLSMKEGAWFHQHIPGSQFIVYPNSGHVPMEEIPQISGEDALHFLQN